MAEADLERITHDLKLPMLADIGRQLSEIRNLVVQSTPPPQARLALAATDAGSVNESGERQQQAVAQAAAAVAAAVDEEADRLDSVDEALLQKARDVIDRGMMARTQNGSTVGEVISNELAKSRLGSSPSASSNPGSYLASRGHKTGEHGSSDDDPDPCAGSVIAHVRRVRFDLLKQGVALGHGTFGVVYAGKYNGKDVAIKKARGPIYARQTILDFRCD